MDKAAENEQRKLKATFWNNLAVGAALTGFILPLLWTFAVRGPRHVEIYRSIGGGLDDCRRNRLDLPQTGSIYSPEDCRLKAC